MPNPSPKLYDLKKTTIGFAIASAVLFIGLVMMLLQDTTREWKGWQRKFMDASRQKAESDLQAAEKSLDKTKLDSLKKDLDAAAKELAGHRAEINKLRKEISKIDIEIVKASAIYQGIKQFQDSDRYFFEESRAAGHKGKAEKYQKALERREPELTKAKLALEALQGRRDEENGALQKFTEKETALDRQIKKMTKETERVWANIEKNKPGLVKAILNAPMLDFIHPTLQIQQIVVENLKDDYYFTRVEKVDRCITCHLGIDQKGFEGSGQPFKTHPRLDLFLSPNSPHPMEKFGCTVCHGGSGLSVSFVTAAHTPQTKDQEGAWKKRYGWRPVAGWDEKMLPLNHVEAACAKCHTGVVDVPQAPKLNEGRRLAQTYGCFGCHKVEGFNDRWKAGPSLEHVQSKLDADWIVRWLQNPKEFRPSTKMPQIFHLSNTSDAQSVEKNNTAIAGIAAYLVKNSDPVSLDNPPAKGDPKIGEQLVKEIGCLGCHTSGSLAANDHGPELSSLGSKVKADWLYTWLKNPKHYFPATRMPNLRLTDEEASNITAYLLLQRNEKFESIRPPHVKPAGVDELAMAFMTGKMRHEEAKEKLDKMNADERLEFVGKQSIAHQGCFACHTIKGFSAIAPGGSASGGEDAKPIATELSEEGSKEINKLDFGFIPLERTRRAWFFQKLKEPRIFDQGKEKLYHEKLRMPQFGFTDSQAQSLVTFLLSLQKSHIPLEMQRRLTMNEEKIESGRLLIAKFNCQGCHTLDGTEGRVRSMIEDKGNAPPVLDGAGSKVQSAWLYPFLDHPTPIRPWLKYRMPTFGFDEKELNTLVGAFNQLAHVPDSYKEEKISPTSEELTQTHDLFKMLQCIKCHKSNPEAGLTASFLAPDLLMAKNRLRPDWVLGWLKDPQALQPGTMMPGFFPEGQSPVKNILDGDAEKQIRALRDYLWAFTPEEAASVTPAPAKVIQGKGE